MDWQSVTEWAVTTLFVLVLFKGREFFDFVETISKNRHFHKQKLEELKLDKEKTTERVLQLKLQLYQEQQKPKQTYFAVDNIVEENTQQQRAYEGYQSQER